MTTNHLIDRIDAIVEKHMSLLLRGGSLFCLFFFAIYVPSHNYYNVERMLHDSESRYQDYVHNSSGVITDLSGQVEGLNKKYAKNMVFEKEAKCLADNIYYEIGTDDRDGMLAVAQVTMNRVRAKFAPSVCGVVYQKTSNKKTGCQFSWVCRIHNVPPGRTYHRALEVAQKSLTKGIADSRLYQALYYHADYVRPSWAESKTFVTQIGPHIFYAEESRAF